MNILTTLLRGLGAKKGADGGYPGTWNPVTSGNADGVNAANLLEANKEWVYIATDKNAKSAASIRLKVMRFVAAGDDREVFDGPLVSFLESPAAGFTGKDFVYLNTAYKELTGNAFWERLGGGKLRPLIPTKMAPIVESGVLVGFRYSDGPQQRTILAKDVLHDRYVDPAKPYWGAGKLQKIAKWVDTSSYLTEFLSRFFVNGATFGGFIETDEETETRIKLIKIGLQNDHVGVANAHKLGVLPKGSKYSKSGANMAEMEMGATDDRYRDKILAGFGVPKTLVGLTTEVNRASAEASEYIYAKYTLKPIADDLLAFLNTTIAPMLDSTGRYYFAYDEFVPVNMDLLLKEREIALAKQPYMTVNEVRASVGLPPVEGGDVVNSSATFTPLGSPEKPAPAPANDNTDEGEPTKAMPARARAGARLERLVSSIATRAVEIATAHQDPDAASHKAFVGRVGDHEKLVADKVRDFNGRQKREVTQRLKQITKAVKQGDLFDMDGEVSLLVDFIGPILKGLMVEQAIAEFIDQGYPGALDSSLPALRTVVEQAARRLAKSYNRTTAKLLEKALNDGIASGEGLNDLTERVHRVYDYSDSVRAAAVARTESFYIANQGSREAFRQSGVVKTMRWYTAEDERVCPWCGPQDGRVIGINEVFFNKGETLTAEGKELVLDYRAIDVPPLHTNCRCFIRPAEISIG
jgi:HK97 family phage portal protein